MLLFSSAIIINLARKMFLRTTFVSRKQLHKFLDFQMSFLIVCSIYTQFYYLNVFTFLLKLHQFALLLTAGIEAHTSPLSFINQALLTPSGPLTVCSPQSCSVKHSSCQSPLTSVLWQLCLRGNWQTPCSFNAFLCFLLEMATYYVISHSRSLSPLGQVDTLSTFSCTTLNHYFK